MKKERVLIVEDERIIALDLQRRLERFDYTVVGLAATGADALEKAKTLAPDIILMDIMLSGDLDGIDAAMVLNKTIQIPVIFLTAFADEKTLERAKAAEPFGYILKPFKDRELYTTIDIALYKYRIDNTLKKQERRFSAILRSIGDGIIATDNERNVQFMNPVAEAITGWQEEEAKTRPIKEILTILRPDAREPLDFSQIGRDKTRSSSVFFKDSVIQNRHGESLPVEGTISAILDRENNPEGHVIALRDITERKQMFDTISYQASHDSLTGLSNRTAFSKALTKHIETAQKENRQHAFIYVDLDQFKLINDTCGHAAGDELLLETTSIIKGVFRSSDICARLGGDEFGILLCDSTQDVALSIAQRLHKRLSGHRLVCADKSHNIHSSMGLVMINTESRDIQTVLAAADDACYLAKDEGGKRIKLYETTDQLFLKRRGEMEWVSRLLKALEEDKFVLFCQPIVPLVQRQNDIWKGEILIRMLDENSSIIPPADFLPAAERYNLMPLIDRWVIRHTLEMSQRIRESKGHDGMERIFTINLSAESVADETFLEYIFSRFEDFGLPPQS
ncbi:MAG: GGDEF domain-containing response regulator, partial [Spirochaetales bacterium]